MPEPARAEAARASLVLAVDDLVGPADVAEDFFAPARALLGRFAVPEAAVRFVVPAVVRFPEAVLRFVVDVPLVFFRGAEPAVPERCEALVDEAPVDRAP